MKMKRNTLTLVLVLVLGLTLFTAATVAASATNVGYETFKTTMEDMNHEGVASGKVEVSVTDNGNTVINMTADAIGNEDKENFSANVHVTDGAMTKEFDVYGQEDAVYLIDLIEADYYKILQTEEMGHRGDDYDFDDEDYKMTSVEEELLDYFVGDLKDNFSAKEEADGSKTLAFNMEASEVPTGLNLMIKAATSAEKRTENQREEHMEEMPFLEGFNLEGTPDLTEDVQLNEVAIVLNVDADNNVNSIQSTLAFSGIDADGLYHEVVINVAAEVGYEDVQPATIDTEAYNWEVIEHDEDFEGGHRR